MDLVQISNLFNAIAQAHPSINFYHYGWSSDQNVNITNNFTGENTRGKKYPALHFDFPSENVEISTKDNKSSLTAFLVFTDTQYYESDGGATDLRSIIEVQNSLKNLAIDVISEFNRIGRTFAGRDHLGTLNPIVIRYDANALADRLVRIFVEVGIPYRNECSAFIADIAALDPPFNALPPLSEDYELK